MRQDLSQSTTRQSPGGSSPVQRLSIRGSAVEDRPVLPRAPTSNLEASQLREVRSNHRTDGAPQTSGRAWHDPDRGDHRDDESSETIRGVENPQRPYAGPLPGSPRRG